MPVTKREAAAFWQGSLTEGSGKATLDSGVASELPVTWAARTEEPGGKTSPEELIAAAHAACFSMALSDELSQAGTPPESLHVNATCTFEEQDEGWRITEMVLGVRGRVPGVDERTFEEKANAAKDGCPVSNALKGNVDIKVQATLEQSS